jgi:hypothetical protein
MTAASDLDLSHWPIVRYRMPEHVPDDLAAEKMMEFESLIARNERYALIFEGPQLPTDSKHFMKLYGDWAKRTWELQAHLCVGSVRVEPDEERRASFASKASADAGRLPYPYIVVASFEEAEAQAQIWLRAAAHTGQRG